MKTGLVLEGGALRTIFSCGVCDAFLEAGLPLPDYTVGTSAGIAYGVSYLSRQCRRNLKLVTTYAGDPRYMSMRNLLNRKNRSYFGLKFTYETSRESLRQMQQQVRRTFSSAQLYINGDATPEQKCAQLYTFLMERFDYQLQTSITPAYSLLSHGVGDNEAFAVVYAAMCRQAGLDCRVVSGTRDGKSWHWNIVREGDVNYHIDLLACYERGQFRWLPDEAMEGYVWDYTAYSAQTE